MVLCIIDVKRVRNHRRVHQHRHPQRVLLFWVLLWLFQQLLVLLNIILKHINPTFSCGSGWPWGSCGWSGSWATSEKELSDIFAVEGFFKNLSIEWLYSNVGTWDELDNFFRFNLIIIVYRYSTSCPSSWRIKDA